MVYHLPIMEKLFGKNFFILAKTFVCSYVVIIALQRGFVYNVGQRCDKNIAGKNVFQMMFNAQTEGGGWHGNGGDGWLRIMEFMPDGKTIKIKNILTFLCYFPHNRKNMHGVLKNLTNLILY